MSKAKSRSINTIIWEDNKFETFSPDEKWFWTTILINPRSNNLGAYKLTIRVLQNLLGYDKTTIENLIYRFKNTYEMIDYDFSTQEILILNWSKYNWTKSPKFKTNLVKLIEKIESKVLLEQIEMIFNEFYTEIVEPKQEKLVEVPFGVSVNELFNRFWSAYPKKQAKGNAEKWFKKHKPSEELVDKMIRVVNKWKNSENWTKDNGKYIPLPTTWLNGKRWEDEMQVEVNGNDEDLWDLVYKTGAKMGMEKKHYE